MMPKLYDQLASWWPLLSPPEEYVGDGEFYARTLAEAASRPVRRVLELGSGGGNNASFMKKQFEMTLVDPSPGMLEVSRALNPECEHVEGDMRTARLGREFDAVFVHDAIVYMTTLEDLRKAMETACVHCRLGGAVLFAPDHVRETFRPGTDHGGYDRGGRGLRYLEWTWDPDPEDCTYLVDYAYMLRGEDGEVQVEYDRHVEGLFSRKEWLELMRTVGFREQRSVLFEHPEIEPGIYELFAGARPAGEAQST